MYFPSSSKTTALRDLDQIRSNIFFPDRRCDTAIQFSACYILNVPCVDSLPRPICMDDCIVAETILRYACVKEFRLILVINNTLSRIVGQFDCHRPETYIEGTADYSTQCLPLVKLRKCVCVYVRTYLYVSWGPQQGKITSKISEISRVVYDKIR